MSEDKERLERHLQTILSLDIALDAFLAEWKNTLDSEVEIKHVEAYANQLHGIYDSIGLAIGAQWAAYLTAALLKVHLGGGIKAVMGATEKCQKVEASKPTPRKEVIQKNKDFQELMKSLERDEKERVDEQLHETPGRPTER